MKRGRYDSEVEGSDQFEDWIEVENPDPCFWPPVHTQSTGHKRACLVESTGLGNRPRPNWREQYSNYKENIIGFGERRPQAKSRKLLKGKICGLGRQSQIRSLVSYI